MGWFFVCKGEESPGGLRPCFIVMEFLPPPALSCSMGRNDNEPVGSKKACAVTSRLVEGFSHRFHNGRASTLVQVKQLRKDTPRLRFFLLTPSRLVLRLAHRRGVWVLNLIRWLKTISANKAGRLPLMPLPAPRVGMTTIF